MDLDWIDNPKKLDWAIPWLYHPVRILLQHFDSWVPGCEQGSEKESACVCERERGRESLIERPGNVHYFINSKGEVPCTVNLPISSLKQLQRKNSCSSQRWPYLNWLYRRLTVHPPKIMERVWEIVSDICTFIVQVCIIGDSVGSILAYDALCRNVKRSASDGSVADADISPGGKLVRFNLFELTFYESWMD